MDRSIFSEILKILLEQVGFGFGALRYARGGSSFFCKPSLEVVHEESTPERADLDSCTVLSNPSGEKVKTICQNVPKSVGQNPLS